MTYVRPTGNVLLRFVLEPRRVTATRGRRRRSRRQELERSGPGGGFGNPERAETGGQGGATAEPRTGDAYTVHAGDPDRPVCGSKSSSNKRAARRESGRLVVKAGERR